MFSVDQSLLLLTLFNVKNGRILCEEGTRGRILREKGTHGRILREKGTHGRILRKKDTCVYISCSDDNSCVCDLSDVCLAPADALFVQIECPLLTPERLASATASCTTSDPYHSMPLSHSASATGVALSTGQLPQATNSLEGSQAKQYPGVCKKYKSR